MAVYDVIVVGGGIIGTSSAYYLSKRDMRVALLDQGAISNPQASSCDHGRIFRLTHGKDSFYTDLASRTLPMWKQFQQDAREELLLQNGVLELATGDGRYEDAGYKVLKELGLNATHTKSQAVCERYRVLRRRGFRFAVGHSEGGMVWARRAIEAFARMAQKSGARLETGAKIQRIIKKKEGVVGLKDSKGRVWKAKNFVFAAGAWTKDILKSFGLPLTVTRQEHLYLRPPRNQGRYRPTHLPAFVVNAKGFQGLPVHIHGFMKVGVFKRGPVVRQLSMPLEPDKKFENKARKFLKEYFPDLFDFTDMEGKVYLYTRTPDGDFILDRLPGQPNAWVAAGFAGNGPMFAPLVGQTVAQLVVGEKPPINLHRFRISRLKLRPKR